jgi:hypothetical protein
LRPTEAVVAWIEIIVATDTHSRGAIGATPTITDPPMAACKTIGDHGSVIGRSKRKRAGTVEAQDQSRSAADGSRRERLSGKRYLN